MFKTEVDTMRFTDLIIQNVEWAEDQLSFDQQMNLYKLLMIYGV